MRQLNHSLDTKILLSPWGSRAPTYYMLWGAVGAALSVLTLFPNERKQKTELPDIQTPLFSESIVGDESPPKVLS